MQQDRRFNRIAQIGRRRSRGDFSLRQLLNSDLRGAVKECRGCAVARAKSAVQEREERGGMAKLRQWHGIRRLLLDAQWRRADLPNLDQTPLHEQKIAPHQSLMIGCRSCHL